MVTEIKSIEAATFILDCAIIELARFAGSDENRYNLTFLQLSRGENNTLIAVATDDYGLAKVILPAPEGFEGTVYLSAEWLLTLKPKKNEAVTITVSQSSTEAMLSQRASKSAVNQHDVNYPDWERRCTPKETATVYAHKFGFDAAYVGDVAIYLKKIGAPNTHIVFTAPSNDMAPMTLSASFNDVSFTYILMPCRI